MQSNAATATHEFPASNWRTLIRPERVEVDSKSNETYGKFVVRPLERGFGNTLGNALRRILLSSLQGAAITRVEVKGVLEGMGAIPGVVDDVSDIVLNLKGVRLATDSTGAISGRIQAKATGKGMTRVTAGDLSFDGDVVVTNPDHPIATLTGTGTLEVDVVAEMGQGYVLGGDAEVGDGALRLDARFSPIRKVRYLVTNARVGQRTDYDRLTLEIWTDGRVTPEDALVYASRVFREQIQVFINFEEEEEPAPGAVDAPSWPEWLGRRVDELELSVRSANCLRNANIVQVWQLCEKAEAELLKTKNLGRKSLNEIKDTLAELELSLGMDLTGYPKV
jgi:DNA-directed RNA polymerase subunit alpha